MQYSESIGPQPVTARLRRRVMTVISYEEYVISEMRRLWRSGWSHKHHIAGIA